MDADAQQPDNGWKIGLAAFGLLVFIGTVAGLPHRAVILIFGAAGLLSILGSILIVLRWLNRRDDPRHAKLPPDDP